MIDQHLWRVLKIVSELFYGFPWEVKNPILWYFWGSIIKTSSVTVMDVLQEDHNPSNNV